MRLPPPTSFVPAALMATGLSLLAAACAGPQPGAGDAPDAGRDLAPRARELAERLLIVDTHVDVPYRLVEKDEDISQRTATGDFDHPRAQAGGLDVPFMSIYVPASFQAGGAKAHADRLIDMVEGFEKHWPDKFAVARSSEDARRIAAEGLIALPMGMENGAPIEGDMANLEHFHRRGIRYITLTHSENNHISDSSYAVERKWNGLSPFGREVVGEMNRLGIMVDVSHISDAAFKQVMEITRAPVIASHSSCRHFTPGWERNMSDEMIRRLADNGGVIQINFGSAFLTKAAQTQSTEYWTRRKGFQVENKLKDDDPRLDEFRDEFFAASPRVYADVSDVADHIDHVVNLVGVEHVGIGSDFDGVGDSLPTGLKDVSQFPSLIRVLLERGYSETDIAAILGENAMRVWQEVEAVSRRLQSAG